MKNTLSQNLKTNIEKIMEVNFGTDLKNGSIRQVYEALLVSTNRILAEKRAAFNKKVKEEGAKQVYYMSMEFLVGTSLKNNLWNLGVEKDIKEWLKDSGFDIEEFYEMAKEKMKTH